ncbi:MAG: hypothetical protein AMJ78_00055 [Omnitrophica WOR_2 bacterium SM23_29]|nr:MAG: hypothetical protein AMJ78_00055 [Omnitrophica WOR_2 bacterium SM23_29]
MSVSSKKDAVKIFIGFIFARKEVYFKTKRILEKKFGQSDFESQTLPFNHTRYYEKEFGANLKRKFLSFKRLTRPGKLAQIKVVTNKIEQRLNHKGKRQINIDPGILTLSKIILASTKDYKHRIYLAKKIFAEVTLYFQNKSFHAWEWTYPDYKTPEYIQIFNHIRDIYSRQLKNRTRDKL